MRILFALAFCILGIGSVTAQTAAEYVLKGKSKYAKSDYSGAKLDYNKAIELDPKFAEAYFERGNLKAELMDYSNAVQDYDKAISLEPGNGIYILNRSYSYYALKETDKARLDAEKAESLGAAVPPAYLQLLRQ